MTNRRLKVQDLIQKEFYKLPKAMIWNRRYRTGVTTDAKFLYMLIRDRFTLSEHTTMEAIKAGQDNLNYVDEKGHLYCILDNAEIEFVMNKNNKQIKRFLDELVAVDLIEIEKEKGRAHRIYFKNPDTHDDDFATFLGEKDYVKHVAARKRKKLEPIKTLEQCIKARRTNKKEEVGQSDLPTQNQDSEGVSQSDLPGVSKNDLPSEVKSTNPGKSNRPTNYNELKELDPSELESSDIESSSNDSEQKEQPEKLEEEKYNKINVANNYEKLEEILQALNFSVDKKGLNVIKKTLMENKVECFKTSDVAYAVMTHRQNVVKYREKGEPVEYEPVFFANNLIDHIAARVREAAAVPQEAGQGSSLPESGFKAPVRFYNWLEDRE